MSILVVLDTNVVVSAGIRPEGHPARIMDAALAGAVVPVVCPAVVAEYHDVVTRPRFRRWAFPPRWLAALVAGAHVVDRDPPPWPHRGPDPDDLVFLALAHLTGAVVVTGNGADFPPAIRGGVVVMSPGAYVAELERMGVRW